MNRAELLGAGGDREKLEMALHYGRDAVYLAGKKIRPARASRQFRRGGTARGGHAGARRLREGLCHGERPPHEAELRPLSAYLELLADVCPDALIVADLGVMALAKKYAPKLPLHVSTQFGVLNSETARALADLGAARVILAREMRLGEIAQLRKNTPPTLELEAFVHGAMCVSISAAACSATI
jgi:putative protease